MQEKEGRSGQLHTKHSARDKQRGQYPFAGGIPQDHRNIGIKAKKNNTEQNEQSSIFGGCFFVNDGNEWKIVIQIN